MISAEVPKLPWITGRAARVGDLSRRQANLVGDPVQKGCTLRGGGGGGGGGKPGRNLPHVMGSTLDSPATCQSATRTAVTPPARTVGIHNPGALATVAKRTGATQPVGGARRVSARPACCCAARLACPRR